MPDVDLGFSKNLQQALSRERGNTSGKNPFAFNNDAGKNPYASGGVTADNPLTVSQDGLVSTSTVEEESFWFNPRNELRQLDEPNRLITAQEALYFYTFPDSSNRRIPYSGTNTLFYFDHYLYDSSDDLVFPEATPDVDTTNTITGLPATHAYLRLGTSFNASRSDYSLVTSKDYPYTYHRAYTAASRAYTIDVTIDIINRTAIEESNPSNIPSDEAIDFDDVYPNGTWEIDIRTGKPGSQVIIQMMDPIVLFHEYGEFSRIVAEPDVSYIERYARTSATGESSYPFSDPSRIPSADSWYRQSITITEDAVYLHTNGRLIFASYFNRGSIRRNFNFNIELFNTGISSDPRDPYTGSSPESFYSELGVIKFTPEALYGPEDYEVEPLEV